MAFPLFDKDPDALLDYTIDWTAWLGTDTLSASAWAISPTGQLVQPALPLASNTTTKATIWLEGGTVGVTYTIINSITTVAGRKEDRTIQIIIKER